VSAPEPPAVALVGAVSPLIVGAAHFNDALARALTARSRLELVSWRRMYPPMLYGAAERTGADPAGPEFVLDWVDPRTWREAALRIERSGASAVLLPWLHPVLAPQYRYLLRRLRGIRRVVICHNVVPHEPRAGTRAVTRSVLERADLLVTHAPAQARELGGLGLGGRPRLELFHPRFVAADLAPSPGTAEVTGFRASLGDPELVLLCFGAVRPYKGFDLAVRALARLPEERRPALLIAGRFWHGADDYRRLVAELGLERSVRLVDRYVDDGEAALFFAAADGVVLPYRSASQSGVVQLAFAYGRPVVAAAVGGLPDAVADGVDGLLCPPNDVVALTAALDQFAVERERLARGVRQTAAEHSFDAYAERLLAAVEAG
jgi:glycosyltransferase involved in cell wall biosynthesis